MSECMLSLALEEDLIVLQAAPSSPPGIPVPAAVAHFSQRVNPSNEQPSLPTSPDPTRKVDPRARPSGLPPPIHSSAAVMPPQPHDGGVDATAIAAAELAAMKPQASARLISETLGGMPAVCLQPCQCYPRLSTLHGLAVLSCGSAIQCMYAATGAMLRGVWVSQSA